MDMIGKVRRMRLRDQLSLSEIAKRTGLSRNTVKKWLKAPGDVVPKYERVKLDGKLTAFEPILHQALTTDSHRPKQDGAAAELCLLRYRPRAIAAATAPSPTTSGAGGWSPQPVRPRRSFR